MSKTHSPAGYGTYWITWGILLAITGLMLVAEVSPFSRAVVASLLLAAMMLKALLIGGQFMHLRFEHWGLTLVVAGTVFFLAAFLFVLIAFDGLRILHMVAP